MFANNKTKYERLNYRLIVIFKLFIVLLLSLRLSFLPHDIFKDRVNYLFAIFNSEDIFFNLFEEGWLLLLREPLFKLISYILSLSLESEFILSLYVFINCFTVFSFILLSRKKFLYSFVALLVLLITPYIFASTLGAVQQGLGLNIILISLLRRNSVTSNRFVIALFLASLFHVIFYVFLGTVVFYRIITRFNKNEVLPLFFVSCFLILVGLVWGVVTPLLNSTQSYEGYETITSGITFVGWFIVFLAFLSNYLYLKNKRIFFNKSVYILSLFFFMCFLVFYWLAPGPYRVLYSAMPLIVYSIFIHINKYSLLCLLLLMIYSVALILEGASEGSLNITYNEFIKEIFYLR